MRVLYYNCEFGISGLMNVSAMLDLGMPLDYLLGELSKLNISGYSLEASKVNRNGIEGMELNLVLEQAVLEQAEEELVKEKNRLERRKESPEFLESLEAKKRRLFNFQNRYYLRRHYSAMRKHIEFSLSKKARNARKSRDRHEDSLQEGLSCQDVLDIISNSFISDKSKRVSLDIFAKLSEAEAQVQGKAKEELVFKQGEILPFLIEIVASAIALDYFKVDKVYATSLELGGGFSAREGDTSPISAIATNLLLEELPCVLSGRKLGSTDAVGVAFLLAVVDEFNEKVSANILSMGLGFADRQGVNNLRVSLLELDEGLRGVFKEEIVEFSANLDEISLSDFKLLREELLALGALDIWQYPIIRGDKSTCKITMHSSLKEEDKLMEAFFRLLNTNEIIREIKIRCILGAK